MSIPSVRVKLYLTLLTLGLAAAGCESGESTGSRDGQFRPLIVTFVRAAADSSTSRLSALGLDERAIVDARLLQSEYPDLLQNPDRRIADPYRVLVRGDTAFVFLRAKADGWREFATELRRTETGWKIVRIGFPPS